MYCIALADVLFLCVCVYERVQVVHGCFLSTLNTCFSVSKRCLLQSEISSRSWVISAAQIHNVMMIRLACSPVFADWLKRKDGEHL